MRKSPLFFIVKAIIETINYICKKVDYYGLSFRGVFKFLDKVNAEKNGIIQEQVEEQGKKNISLGRNGKPEEFAKFVTFLVSWCENIRNRSIIFSRLWHG